MMFGTIHLLWSLLLLVVATTETEAFTSIYPVQRTLVGRRYAGGFEWEDPGKAANQGVENPFKNPSLMTGGEGNAMKIDPARLLGPRLSGTNLYFIGMMGSGKTAVGDVVARRMGTYNFLDTDQIIEQVTKMSIPDLFDAEGEEGFRLVEGQVLDSVHAYIRCVVSTGGGIVQRMENWSKLQTGIVVWLDVPAEVICQRLEQSDGGIEGRPLLAQSDDPVATLQELMEKRQSFYSQADIRVKVEADMSVDEVAFAVVKQMHDYIDDNPPAWKMAKAKAQAEGLDWVK